MPLIRSRLVAVALALLAWQIAGVANAPVALCCVSPAGEEPKEDVACTCDHTVSAACPMHKTEKKQSTVPQTRWCAGSDDQATLMILTMLAGSGGVPECRHQVIRPAPTSERVFLVAAALPDAASSLVSPPPKG